MENGIPSVCTQLKIRRARARCVLATFRYETQLFTPAVVDLTRIEMRRFVERMYDMYPERLVRQSEQQLSVFASALVCFLHSF